nr:hypothetical protein CPGR_01931 [Mycolicibacterium komanii]
MRGLCRKMLSHMGLSVKCEGVLRGWLVGSREKKFWKLPIHPFTPLHTLRVSKQFSTGDTPLRHSHDATNSERG